MSGFFTKRHEDYPDPVKPEQIKFTGHVNSVSFSTMSTFEQCPHAVYLNKVSDIPGLSSPAADRGSRLHEMLEHYVLGTLDEVKWNLFKAGNYYAPIIDSFREAHSAKPKACIPELQLAFDKNMKRVRWDAKKAWLRAMIDVAWFEGSKSATIYDYKSGSNQSAAKHRAQLMLYAMLMFIAYPKLEKLSATAIYLDLKLENFYTNYVRHDLELYWPRYRKRLEAVTNCVDFQPNPNAFTCKWCQHKVKQEGLGQVAPACAFGYIK